MPAKLIKGTAFRVGLRADNFLVFIFRDGPLFAIFDLGPVFFGEEGPGKPVHIESEVVQLTKENVCGNSSLLHHR
jgi:hypothetical protein